MRNGQGGFARRTKSPIKSSTLRGSQDVVFGHHNLFAHSCEIKTNPKQAMFPVRVRIGANISTSH